MPDSNFHFEEVIFPKLIAERQLSGYLTDEKYYSISTPERAKITEEFFRNKL